MAVPNTGSANALPTITTSQPTIITATDSTVALPQGAWILQADFSRLGPDLVITGPNGQQIVVRDYFAQPNPPDLVGSDGVVISGDTAARLAGPLAPAQYAQ